jgi:hypothetical protein
MTSGICGEKEALEGLRASRALPGRDEKNVVVGLQVRWFSLAEPRFTTG